MKKSGRILAALGWACLPTLAQAGDGGIGAMHVMDASAYAAAPASESIELVDATDSKSFAQYQDLPSPAGATIGAFTSSGPASAMIDPFGEKRTVRVESPRPTPTGFRLGVEISLDEGDQIELKDNDRLVIEGSFGRIANFAPLSMGTGLSLLNSGARPSLGLDNVSLLTRASALGANPVSLSLGAATAGAPVPQYAGVMLGYSTNDRLNLAPGQRGFGIALSSTLMVQGPDTGGLGLLNDSPLGIDERAYNFGLNVGYRGFTFAASFLRGEGFADARYESYDIGLSYDFGNWATSLAVGGYFLSDGTITLSRLVDIDRIYSVELGASYAIKPWLRVLGRLQFFDYQTLLSTGPDGLGGTVYLGTSLGF